MEDRNYYINQGIDNSGVSKVEKFNKISDYIRQQDPTFLMEESRLRPNSGTYFGASSSKFDKNLPSVDQLMAEGLTADQARGIEQPVFNRIGNALVNNAVIAGTTAISGSLGVIWGAIDALANQELNKLYDNPVNKKMLELQEATAKAAPNYYTKEYEESSIWKKLGTSIFWADLIKNLGFTEGMLIPGMGVSAALSKTPMAMQLIGSSVAGALSEASIEAIQAKQDKLNLESTQIANEYNKAILAAKSPEERRLIDQEYNKTLQGIEDDANKVGNYVLGYNMALLTATNSLEWGKLFTRGNKASRAALLAKERSQGIKAAKDGLSLNIEQPWLNTAKNLGNRGYQALTEGMEEVLQDVAVKAADLNPNYNSFNESVFNPEKRELANSSLQSLGMAFSQAMKDSDTATDFAMGFFTSVLGSPRFRSPKENGKWRSPITMEGGVTEFLRERREYGKRKALVDEINRRLSDPTFEEYYKGIVRDNDLTSKANLALEAGDEFNFHNYQFASMISDIIMFDNVGQFNLFNNILDKASAISNSEIKSLIDSGLFQQNGNPMSEEDARNKIQENVELMRGLASQYRKIKENLEASDNGSQLSKDALENIIYAKMQLDNWRKRQTDISNELVNLYKDDIYDNTDEKAVSPEHFRLLATLPAIRDELKRLIEESELTDDVKETWIKKIEDLNKIQDNMKKFSDKINEYYSSPQKANIAQEKIKEKAVKNDQKRKVDIAKEQLQKATTPKALRNVYNGILNKGDLTEAELTKAVNELIEEGNAVAVENKNIQSLYQGTIAKISNMGLDNQETSNAIQMLNTAMNNARNIAEMIEPSNPSYTEISTFFNSENPSSGNPVLDKETFLKAQVIVAKALQEQLKEMGKNAEAAKFTTTENPAPGTNESGTTGNSGVSEAPSAKGHDSTPSASITSENGEPGVSAGNLPANYDNSGVEQQPDTNESQKKEMDEETPIDPNKSWFPLSWFFLGSKKKGVLIPISDTQAIQKEDASVNFGQIPQWIEQNRVQEHVDTGNLKIGDKLVLGIPSDLKDINGNPVIVYYKVIGDDYMPVGIFTASGNLAKNIKSKVLEEYKKADQSKSFFSSITTTVNDIKTGYVEYGESRNLDSTDNITFAIVRNGSLDLGASSIKLNEVNRPKNISQKNGMVYIAIPNSRIGMSGGYTLVGAKVKKFNSKEFDLTSPKNAESPVVKNIRKSVEAIINAKTQADLLNRLQELSKYLYIPNLNFYIVGDGAIRVTKNVLDISGKVVKKLVKKANGTSVYENSETVVGVYKDPESLFGDLYKMGLNFNIDRTSINTPEYNKTIIDSGIVSINAVNTNHTVGGWFTANPVGENGEIKGSKIPFNNPTPSNTPQSNDNSIIVTINNKQVTLFPTGEYLSLKDGVRRLPINPSDVERYKALYTLQKQYGNATEGPTMWNNKAVINGKVIDRTTGEWVIGAAADEVINKINPKPSPTSTTKGTQSTDSIFQNHDDMNPIEDLSDNSKFPNSKVGYYLDSRDNKIHKTYMVSAGEILGTPIQIIKIPVLTSGLNSKGPKKLAGYNYGIVLPNGQSYIGTNLNVETPINTVFEGIKKSFEGPGAGPKGQEFVEKHKKEFTELKNMPSVFPTEVSAPIGTEVKQETPATTADNDEMSFEDFAAMMGADISGNPTAKLREAKKESEKFDIDKEVKWLSTVLPNIPVETVEGLIHIAGKNAWGTFSNAGITLSNVAAEGTAYHEAFHAVFSLGLNGNERANLMKEASEESKLTDPIELEEWLAERFREYVINQKSKTVGQKIKEFFKKLWNLIKGIQEAEPMRYSIYKKIMSSKYKNIKVGTTEESSTRLRPEEYTPEMLDILSTAKYDKDGNILAPNGKPSNLNERQWVHVRTKAFKEWFGDWETANNLLANLDKVNNSLVDVEQHYKPWREDKTKGNNTLRIYLKDHSKGYFELVKDNEFGMYSVHFKTAREGGKYNAEATISTKEDRKILFKELIKLIPEGAQISTWGELSEDGIKGLNNVGRDFTKVGEREVTKKSDGSKVNIPIYQKGESISKVVDENGEPLVVYHGTLGEFTVFDFNKLGEVTGKGSYNDIITGEEIPIDSSYAFFFTDNKIAAKSYKNLAIWQQNIFRAKVYRNLQAVFNNTPYIFTKFEGTQHQAQQDFIKNIISPYIGFDVLREANKIIENKSTLTETQRQQYAKKFKETANKIEKLADARSISNMMNNLETDKKNLQFLLDNKDNLISNNPIDYFKNRVLSISSGYGIRDKGEVYLLIAQEENGKYYVVGLPNIIGKNPITKDNFNLIVNEFKKGIVQNEKALNEAEAEGKYNTKGKIFEVFLNIKNPLEQDYNESSFTNNYLINAEENDIDAAYYGGNKLKKPLKIEDKLIPTGYIAAKQVQKARKEENDGVIYKNILDPFKMTSYGIFNDNQVKSATDNIGTYSKENNDIRLRKIKEDNELFLENGYSENWIKNATEEEKEVAKYCIGI